MDQVEHFKKDGGVELDESGAPIRDSAEGKECSEMIYLLYVRLSSLRSNTVLFLEEHENLRDTEGAMVSILQAFDERSFSVVEDSASSKM
ncbi:hypothetical protein MLD52_04120 [Puniceicoccaceae bacterium K14]|nr:hypothetical protein [Puniceicoccaceae bacterium K14]